MPGTSETLLDPRNVDGLAAAIREGLDRGRSSMGCSTVDVYWTDLDASVQSAAEMVGLLDEGEQARASRFRFERDRRRFVLRRGVLRTVLADRLNCDSAAICFTQNAFGKPALYGSDLRFNVSHSHGLALYAVAQSVELGCDVERRDERTDIAGTARSLFAPGEINVLEHLPSVSQRDEFFRCWTRKEAYVKALGFGLSHPLNGFDVLAPGDVSPGWSIRSFEPQRLYYAAVASQVETMELVLHAL